MTYEVIHWDDRINETESSKYFKSIFQGLNCLLNSSNIVCYWLLNSLLCYTMLTKVWIDKKVSIDNFVKIYRPGQARELNQHKLNTNI